MSGWGLELCYEALWKNKFYSLQELRNANIFLTSQCCIKFLALTLFTQQVFGMIMVEIIQIYPSGNTIMKSLRIFSLGCRSTAISFVTLRKSIFTEISFCENNFCVCINFQELRRLLANLQKFISVKFDFFFYPWKWIHSKLLLSSLFDVVLILKESNSTVWWFEFRTLLIDGFHFR